MANSGIYATMQPRKTFFKCGEKGATMARIPDEEIQRLTQDISLKRLVAALEERSRRGRYDTGHDYIRIDHR
jgi:hypothetical protein